MFDHKELWFVIGALVLALAVTCGWYAITDNNCKDRGGHTEFIWGDDVSWTCAEADR